MRASSSFDRQSTIADRRSSIILIHRARCTYPGCMAGERMSHPAWLVPPPPHSQLSPQSRAVRRAHRAASRARNGSARKNSRRCMAAWSDYFMSAHLCYSRCVCIECGFVSIRTIRTHAMSSHRSGSMSYTRYRAQASSQ